MSFRLSIISIKCRFNQVSLRSNVVFINCRLIKYRSINCRVTNQVNALLLESKMNKFDTLLTEMISVIFLKNFTITFFSNFILSQFILLDLQESVGVTYTWGNCHAVPCMAWCLRCTFNHKFVKNRKLSSFSTVIKYRDDTKPLVCEKNKRSFKSGSLDWLKNQKILVAFPKQPWRKAEWL